MGNHVENIIIIMILILIVGLIAFYLIKAKKRGETCIGCPYAKQCKNRCNGSCNQYDTKNKQI